MALGRWYHGNIKELPEMRTHIPGTPDVPDLIRPGDWATNNGIGIVLVVKTVKAIETEWDYCPGAESWWIYYLGSGYMTGEHVSMNDCGMYSHVVAVDGRLLQLYKLGWNEREVRVVLQPKNVTVTKSVLALIQRENRPSQLELFPPAVLGRPA